MDLEHFIASSLKQIIAGIRRAQDDAGTDKEGLINPELTSAIVSNTARVGTNILQTVGFDVAVTASETTELNAGGGISVVGLKIGAGAKSGDSSSSVSRIQFSVPIALPVGKPKDPAT